MSKKYVTVPTRNPYLYAVGQYHTNINPRTGKLGSSFVVAAVDAEKMTVTYEVLTKGTK